MKGKENARIVGGLGSPHAPSIGVAYNTGKHETPAWKPLFDGYKPMQAWLEEKRPDLAGPAHRRRGVKAGQSPGDMRAIVGR